jgi:uncharacterized membrane protein YfcA
LFATEANVGSVRNILGFSYDRPVFSYMADFFILLGICAGTLSGLLGLGSGIILIPTLVLLCGFAQKSAQGTTLAVMVPMILVGAL